MTVYETHETHETVSLSATVWVQGAKWRGDRRPLLHHTRGKGIIMTLLKKDMACKRSQTTSEDSQEFPTTVDRRKQTGAQVERQEKN